jgi:hypothetical protein
MLAHAIPIYWGPPDVGHAFNLASIVDARALSEDELVAEVRRLDEDDTAYKLKLMEPWFPGDVAPTWLRAGFQDQLVTHVLKVNKKRCRRPS